MITVQKNRATFNRLLSPLAIFSLLGSACAVDLEMTLSATEETSEESAEETVKFLRAESPIPGRYIVVLKDGALRQSSASAAFMGKSMAVEYKGNVVLELAGFTNGFVSDMSEVDAVSLSEDPRVAFVEEDGYVYANATQNNAIRGLDRIDQRNLPLNSSYKYTADASGVEAYIIDTGIRVGHNDFGGRAVHGFSAINDGRGSNDCNGHGTHVAGTVGSSTFGVAKNVKLIAVRVLDCDGAGSNSGVIAGINYVAQNATLPAVANMSLGGTASQALDNAVQNAINAGITFVVAAGNENQDACNGSPNRVPSAITVGSSTVRDRRSSFSNVGSCVDIFAPGSSIRSTSNGSNSATATLSGTSMASPHVAGAAALVLSANPSASPADVANALINNATEGKLSGLRGSPNLLLYTGFIDSNTPEPQPEEPQPEEPEESAEGTPRSSLDARSVRRGGIIRYQPVPVLPGSKIRVELSGNGDADLYLRFDANPTFTRYNCRPYKNGSSEICEGTVPAGTDTLHIMVHGFKATSYRLKGDWVAP